jgi:hypothetical protein
VSLEEATVSNIWEIARLWKCWSGKASARSKTSLRQHHRTSPQDPRAGIPETSFPEPYLLSETENTIINDILDLLNKHGLTSHQSLNLLERLGRIIEMGQRVEKGTMH